jgi:hypothetical protein
VELHFKFQIVQTEKIYGDEMVNFYSRRNEKSMAQSYLLFTAAKKRLLLLRKEWILTKWHKAFSHFRF